MWGHNRFSKHHLRQRGFPDAPISLQDGQYPDVDLIELPSSSAST